MNSSDFSLVRNFIEFVDSLTFCFRIDQSLTENELFEVYEDIMRKVYLNVSAHDIELVYEKIKAACGILCLDSEVNL